MRVLHVMKVVPFPPTNGFRSDIYARLQSMHRLGYRVHVLVTAERGDVEESYLEELRKIVQKIDFVKKTPMLECIFCAKPILVARNRSLAELALNNEYDVTLAESEHVLSIFDNPTLRTRLKVIRVHNNEQKYMWELSKSHEQLKWKLFFANEAFRYHYFEKNSLMGVDAAWFISKEECAKFASRSEQSLPLAMWLPPSIQLQDIRRRAAAPSKKVLFVGGLSNPLNREGISWYLQKVHPLLLDIVGYEVVIAGNTGGMQSARLFIEKAREIARCSLYPDLPDLEHVYDDCAVIINPMLQGSGVKMKTIHAIQQQIPLVTTSVGAEGSGFADRDHIRIADEPRMYADAIREVLNDPVSGNAMAARAYAYLMEHYNSDVNINRLFSEMYREHLDIRNQKN